MKKLLFLVALALIGCENYTTNQESKVIEKGVIVHDTITKYLTHECSKEYGVKATETDYGETHVFEIHNKRTDEIVFYLQPLVIINDAKKVAQKEKAGGKLSTQAKCKHDMQSHTIYCGVLAKLDDKVLINFLKVWPESEFHLIETYNYGTNLVGNTITIFPRPLPFMINKGENNE